MAVNENTYITLPAGCWRQPVEAASLAEDGSPGFTYVAKGGYESLKAVADGVHPGRKVVQGWVAKTWQLQRGRGGSGTLTISCAPEEAAAEPEEGGAAPGEKVPLTDVWSVHSVRNDKSVYAYCGPSAGANPNRVHVELWQKETDAALADLFKFRNADGSVTTLKAQSQALARKILNGIESVVRFYPVITRKRVYSTEPPACMENVGFVDKPDFSSLVKNPKKPGAIATMAAKFEWLKMQDDIDEQTDGNFARTESWWGIETTVQAPHPWDPDLYGAARWSMPADLSKLEGAS